MRLAPILSLILPLVVAACAGGQRAASWPDAISFAGPWMRVSFNDGTVCRANIDAAREGDLTGCRWPLHYRVEALQPSHLAPLPGIGEFFEPYARVRLSAPSGLGWTFRTPHEIPPHEQGEGGLALP